MSKMPSFPSKKVLFDLFERQEALKAADLPQEQLAELKEIEKNLRLYKKMGVDVEAARKAWQ